MRKSLKIIVGGLALVLTHICLSTQVNAMSADQLSIIEERDSRANALQTILEAKVKNGTELKLGTTRLGSRRGIYILL